MTAQVDEILIFNGKKTSISCCPPLPASHPDITRLEQQSRRKTRSSIPSTACQRGYIGTWEIRDSQLYLVDLEGCYQIVVDRPLPADWVSGIIRVPQGKLLYYDRTGCKVYEQEIHVRVRLGKVIESIVVYAAQSILKIASE